MKNNFPKVALLLGIALMTSTAGFSQESKVKIERKNYELKEKREGNEYKLKEKGTRPMPSESMTVKKEVTYKQGETRTRVIHGEPQKQNASAQNTKTSMAKKKSYASRKPCNCKTVARRPVKRSHTVAHGSKTKKTTHRTAAAAKAKTTPVIVRDTIFVTRVDTVFSVMERSSFTGNRPNGHVLDNFKKLKIERENNGEIQLKKEYENGEEIKKTFDNERDFQKYIQWKNF